MKWVEIQLEKQSKRERKNVQVAKTLLVIEKLMIMVVARKIYVLLVTDRA